MMSLVTRFGTGIARTLASDYPGRVKPLILVAPVGAVTRSATTEATTMGFRETLVTAKVALYLKGSLGASTRYLTQFTRAVSKVPDFATGEAEAVRVQSGTRDEQPISILIPLRGLVAELGERLPLAEQARDLPRGRKRAGWKEELRAALLAAWTDAPTFVWLLTEEIFVRVRRGAGEAPRPVAAKDCGSDPGTSQVVRVTDKLADLPDRDDAPFANALNRQTLTSS